MVAVKGVNEGLGWGKNGGKAPSEGKQAFTNLLYGSHEGGEASTVVSWLCVIHKRIAVGG